MLLANNSIKSYFVHVKSYFVHIKSYFVHIKSYFVHLTRDNALQGALVGATRLRGHSRGIADQGYLNLCR